MRIINGNDGTFEVETKKGIFGFDSWNYSDDDTLIELFESGKKSTTLFGTEALALRKYLSELN